jgi:hypothetical protein
LECGSLPPFLKAAQISVAQDLARKAQASLRTSKGSPFNHMLARKRCFPELASAKIVLAFLNARDFSQKMVDA